MLTKWQFNAIGNLQRKVVEIYEALRAKGVSLVKSKTELKKLDVGDQLDELYEGVREVEIGNAIVPNDAPIQPPQAFVGASQYFFNNSTTIVDFTASNSAITSLSIALLATWRANNGLPDLNLSGNALSVSAVNAILAEYVAHTNAGVGSNQAINLSGGTNAAPTGQGLTDKAALITAGWVVTTN